MSGLQNTYTCVILYSAFRANVIPPAPSAPPNGVSVTVVNSTAVTVQWGMVPCIHRNGDITGYSVQYGTQTMSVMGGDAMEAVITGLSPSTEYSIESPPVA